MTFGSRKTALVAEEGVFKSPVAELVGLKVASYPRVRLASSGVEAPDRGLRHEGHYHEA
jgi:hypothetical protein